MAALVRRMLRPALSREELTDIQGQLFAFKVIKTLPEQIEKELQSLLEQEKQQRELKEVYARTTVQR